MFLQFIPNFYKFFRDNSDESALQALVDFFQRLENTIKLHKEKLGLQFIGDSTKPGAADYLIWPWIERTQAYKIASPSKLINISPCFYVGMHAADKWGGVLSNRIWVLFPSISLYSSSS